MKPPPKRLLDQTRDIIRLKHYSIRTEESYISWIKRYILYHGKKHPKEMGKNEIESFLTHLAVNLKVASSTQNQAFNALLFLYREVLKIKMDCEINAVRAKKTNRLPVVMTKEEALNVINFLSGDHKLMAQLLYGSGLRISELINLSCSNLYLEVGQMRVIGKGGKERIVPVGEEARESVKCYLEKERPQYVKSDSKDILILSQ